MLNYDDKYSDNVIHQLEKKLNANNKIIIYKILFFEKIHFIYHIYSLKQSKMNNFP